jgi:TolB-like protein/DNA-binding winged helix-turn-helix (wHTH) protein
MDTLSSTESSLFEGFRLDRRAGVLFRRDERGVFAPMAIGSRALDILGVLVERPGDLVSRAEIMEAVWPGTAVEDSNLNVQVAALRRILDDGRAEGSCIQTVPGRGYRFVAPVTRVERAASPASVLSTGNGSDGLMAENEQAQGPGLLRQIGGIAPASKPRGRHPLWGGVMATVIGAMVLVAAGVAWNWSSLWPRDALRAPRLSIVVLPFANLGNDPEQQYFADGVTEDVTIDLSRIAHMFVISRNTAFTYRNKHVDTKQIGRELGVRYVLEGGVRRSGNQLRVTARLIDAETDAHLWAERFDRATGDLFAPQNEITSRIAAALNLELVGAEAARPTENPDALDYILRGRAASNKGATPDNDTQAYRPVPACVSARSSVRRGAEFVGGRAREPRDGWNGRLGGCRHGTRRKSGRADLGGVAQQPACAPHQGRRAALEGPMCGGHDRIRDGDRFRSERGGRKSQPWLVQAPDRVDRRNDPA